METPAEQRVQQQLVRYVIPIAPAGAPIASRGVFVDCPLLKDRQT
jgi:hypothetical protein